MTHDVIVIAGAPGSGKSTLAKQISDRFESPDIDFGKLREFHLDTGWKKQHPEEEAMAFENLLAIIRNYLAHGYRNVAVHDLRAARPADISAAFPDTIILTLVPDDAVLEERIRPRTGGWTDVEGAKAWNQGIKGRTALVNERRIDNSFSAPEETFSKALAVL